MVPFLLCLCYLNVCYVRVPFILGISATFLFIVTISATTAFGYFLNDVTDRNEDKLAGKKNVTEGISLLKITLGHILLLFLAIIPWFFLPRSWTNLSLFGFQVLLLLIYSVPPIRLKKRPHIAVIIDALYNSVIPLLIIGSTFKLLASITIKNEILILSFAIIWAFLKGLRGILLHQVKDRKNDKKAGITTFVIKYGPFWTINLINKRTLVVELILYVLIITYLSCISFPFLWVIIPLFFVYLFFFFRLWEDELPGRKREAIFRYLYIFNDLYEEWLPIVVLFYLPFLNPWYAVLLPLHLILFYMIPLKIIRNAKRIITYYKDYRTYLVKRRSDLMDVYPVKPPSTALTPENMVVHGLWIGTRLSCIELLTIQSFIFHGHDFHLWVYEKIENLPEKVTTRDANLIIPREDIIIRKFNDPVTGVGKGSVGAPFSDLFRYKLLYEHGGWWVDMDVTCLKPLQFEEPYFFRDHLLLDVIGNVMKCPIGSELMLETFNEAKAVCDENTLDWLLPNKILNKQIRELDLMKFRKNDVSNRDEWPETKEYIRKLKKIPSHWHFIHWSNEEWRMNGLEKEHLRFKNTTLGFLLDKYKIPLSKPEYLKMLKNDIILARPFRIRLPLLFYSESFKKVYWFIQKHLNKIYWYIHGHIKYYIDNYFKWLVKK